MNYVKCEQAGRLKVLFKIRLDKTGEVITDKTSMHNTKLARQTCILLTHEISYRPMEQEVMFLKPQFIVNGHSEINNLYVFDLQ